MVLARTVANGCGRLRTVADGCDRERNVERTHPQPPDPQSETGTLATHSGIINFFVFWYCIYIYVIDYRYTDTYTHNPNISGP